MLADGAICTPEKNPDRIAHPKNPESVQYRRTTTQSEDPAAVS